LIEQWAHGGPYIDALCPMGIILPELDPLVSELAQSVLDLAHANIRKARDLLRRRDRFETWTGNMTQGLQNWLLNFVSPLVKNVISEITEIDPAKRDKVLHHVQIHLGARLLGCLRQRDLIVQRMKELKRGNTDEEERDRLREEHAGISTELNKLSNEIEAMETEVEKLETTLSNHRVWLPGTKVSIEQDVMLKKEKVAKKKQQQALRQAKEARIEFQLKDLRVGRQDEHKIFHITDTDRDECRKKRNKLIATRNFEIDMWSKTPTPSLRADVAQRPDTFLERRCDATGFRRRWESWGLFYSLGSSI